MGARGTVAAIGGAMALAAWGIRIDSTAIDPPYEPLDTTAVYDVTRPWAAPQPAGSPPETLDRYGNVVERAVTDYRLDPTGDIYERHSPSTAIPRLGPPST
jgi:hypothetical protein